MESYKTYNPGERVVAKTDIGMKALILNPLKVKLIGKGLTITVLLAEYRAIFSIAGLAGGFVWHRAATII